MSIIPWLRARLFRRLDAQDERARARGWTVTAGPRGSRIYRDPRWDHVSAIRARGKLSAAEVSGVLTTLPGGRR